ncbi:MAG: tetratricopeptide repeat protein [Cyanobacteriota bacterium]
MNIAEKKLKIKNLVSSAEKYYKKSEISKAKKTYHQAFEIADSIKEKKLSIDFIRDMAVSLFFLGDLDYAKEMFDTELKIRKEINDEKGYALCLLNIAWIYNKKNDTIKEYEILNQAIKDLVNNSMWYNLSDAIVRLYNIDNEKNLYLLAQVLYLAFYTDVHVKNIFFSIVEILKTIGFEDESSPIIASSGVVLININIKPSDNQKIKDNIMESVIACALARKIKEEDISNWITNEGLNDTDILGKKIEFVINNLVPLEKWFFDKEIFSNIK